MEKPKEDNVVLQPTAYKHAFEAWLRWNRKEISASLQGLKFRGFAEKASLVKKLLGGGSGNLHQEKL
eukprot:6924459-Prorocentrum_lima.AAC.1